MSNPYLRTLMAAGACLVFSMSAPEAFGCAMPGDCPACPQCQIATCSGGTMFTEGTCGCAPAPEGSSCSDGAFCNGEETCVSGTCSPGATPCAEAPCDEVLDLCLASACSSTPKSGCGSAAKSKLQIKNSSSDDGKDKLIWTFVNGMTATNQGDFADPVHFAHYALCLYHGTSPTKLGELLVQPSITKWQPAGTKGYKYADGSAADDGVQKIIIKSGAEGKTKIVLKAKGSNLPALLDSAPVLPVLAQLVNYAAGNCWQTSYTAGESTTALFKAKQQP